MTETETIRFEIPSNELVLRMVTTAGNTRDLADGDVFADDGYVYNRLGERKRKWFASYDGVRVWNPVLEDVPALEARRWRLVQAYETAIEAHDKAVRVLWDAVKPHETIVAVPFMGGYRKYVVHNLDIGWYEGPTVSSSWEPEKPKGSRTFPRKGTDVHRTYEHMKDMCRRLGRFNTILDFAIARKLPPPFQQRPGVLVKTVLNGRTYWYNVRSNGIMGGVEWEKVEWPDMDLLEIDLSR